MREMYLEIYFYTKPKLEWILMFPCPGSSNFILFHGLFKCMNEPRVTIKLVAKKAKLFKILHSSVFFH